MPGAVPSSDLSPSSHKYIIGEWHRVLGQTPSEHGYLCPIPFSLPLCEEDIYPFVDGESRDDLRMQTHA